MTDNSGLWSEGITTPIDCITGSCGQTRMAVGRMPALIDTHCHLDCEPLFARLPNILSNARTAGVSAFVVPGVHPDGWNRIMMIVARENDVYPALGIHPMHADLADDYNLDNLNIAASQVIAIGEIGLDPNYQPSLKVQEHAFREQLRIAYKHGLPVLVHCRRHFLRTFQILQEEKASQVGGIMHAFSGSLEMAKEFIRLGFAISLSGTVTWENAARPVRLAANLPLNSIVLETDSPDMTPQPFRGQPNQPAWITEVLSAVAEKRGMTPVDIATAVLANTKRVLPKIETS